MPRAALTASARLGAGWFGPMPPERLAAVRILAGAFAFVRVSVLFGFVLPRAARAEPFVNPVGLMRLLSHAPSFAVLSFVVAVTVLSGLAFVGGYRYRWAAPLFVASLVTILSYFNSFGMLYHSDHLLILHLIVLACAPAADVWSLDARRRARAGHPPVPAADARYGWPIRLLCAVTACVYLLAGIAKIAGSGWAWALGEALREQIAKDAIRKQLLGESSGILGPWVLRSPAAATAMGVMTLVVELGAPLFLLHRRAGQIWAAAAFAMHWGILLIMDITFRYPLTGIAFAAFFPVERLLARIGRLRVDPYAGGARTTSAHGAKPG
jgi:hypothetical protein